jgi:hypothetical protein
MAEAFRRPDLFNFKMYRGLVVDNADPAMIRRARVTIDGLYPTGSNSSLPWVGALTDSPKSFNAPEIGDELCVIFPYDDIYHPFYLGYWNSGTTGNAYLQADYPNTFGFIYANLKARFNKNTKIGEIVHGSGSSLAIDADGNLIITGAKDFTSNPAGKFTVESGDDISFTSGGRFTASSTGDMMFTTEGNLVLSGSGGSTFGSSDAETMILGEVINLGEGGSPVALVGISTVIGSGNLGAPVISQILTGSSTVLAAP